MGQAEVWQHRDECSVFFESAQQTYAGGEKPHASLASAQNGGPPHDLVFGLPLRPEDGRSWSIVEGPNLDEYAESRLVDNVDELEREAAVAGF